MAQHDPATAEQLAERKQIIRNMITAGLNKAAIVRKVREEYAEWDISDRQVRNYVDAAYEGMSLDAGLVDRAAYFVRTLERFDDIYMKATETGNLKVATEANMAIAKLLKLENPSASMDWRKAAKEAGLDTTAAIAAMAERFKRGAEDDLIQ